MSLDLAMDIFRYFIDNKFSIPEAINFLKNTRQHSITWKALREFYTKIRSVIYIDYIIAYSTEFMGLENGNNFYSTDESLFNHDINGNQLWVLGVIENINKDFSYFNKK